MYTDFRQTVPRLHRRIEELRQAVVRDREEITRWRRDDGGLDEGHDPALDDSGWPCDRAVVLRCYEGHNMRGRARLTLGVPVSDEAEVNLLEEEEGPVGVDAGSLTVDVAPFQVRTFTVETAGL